MRGGLPHAPKGRACLIIAAGEARGSGAGASSSDRVRRDRGWAAVVEVVVEMVGVEGGRRGRITLRRRTGTRRRRRRRRCAERRRCGNTHAAKTCASARAIGTMRAGARLGVTRLEGRGEDPGPRGRGRGESTWERGRDLVPPGLALLALEHTLVLLVRLGVWPTHPNSGYDRALLELGLALVSPNH